MSNSLTVLSGLLESRTAYANALNKSLDIFISYTEKSIKDVMSKGLQPIVDAAGLDRIIVFRIFDIKNNTAGEIYRWDKNEGGTAPADPVLKILPFTTAIKHWLSVVSNNTCISLRRSEFTEDEAAFLSPRGVKSILMAPVFVGRDFWGIVTFHDNCRERDFDEDCTSLLRSAARLCAGTIIREEMQSKIKKAEIIKRIHKENKNSKIKTHWYESHLDAIPFLISIQDLNENWVFLNTAAETVLGKKREEVIGTPCKKWGLSICDTEMCAIACAKRGQMRTFFSHENTSYQVDTKLLKDINGKTAGYIEIIQDITQIEQMTKQQAQMEAANSAKSSFLAAMSHEMRTPMNTIIGMAAIGRSAAGIEGKDHALTSIEEASLHLLGVINDVLDMSKIEANKLELSNIAFDLRNSLKKASSFIKFDIKEKRFLFSMEIDSNIPSFFIGDDLRLTQVITNLLGNAVKFTPKDGKISLDVYFAGEEAGIWELRFEVSDSGIGISSEQQEKIFQPFEQAESGSTRKYGGTGLGLVISKRIIELMGGRIWVESEPGKGSRFIFTVKMPRSTEDSRLQPGFADKDEVSVEDIYREYKGKKLLLAEDIEINREILITLLNGTGLIIDTAENGRKAVDMVSEAPEKYDLIFMDMQMPEMDGLEATRRIRAFEAEQRFNEKNVLENAKHSPRLLGHPKSVPIIAMTANVFQDDIEKCHAAGMDDHIGKPLDIAKVLEKLRKYL